MSTTNAAMVPDALQGRPQRVPLLTREPIIEYLLTPPATDGELERLRAETQMLSSIVRSMLLGCSMKDFRHTVQHHGLRLVE